MWGVQRQGIAWKNDPRWHEKRGSMQIKVYFPTGIRNGPTQVVWNPECVIAFSGLIQFSIRWGYRSHSLVGKLERLLTVIANRLNTMIISDRYNILLSETERETPYLEPTYFFPKCVNEPSTTRAKYCPPLKTHAIWDPFRAISTHLLLFVEFCSIIRYSSLSTSISTYRSLTRGNSSIGYSMPSISTEFWLLKIESVVRMHACSRSIENQPQWNYL